MGRRGERAKLKMVDVEELDEPYEITKFDIVEPCFKNEVRKEYYTSYSDFIYWNERARRK